MRWVREKSKFKVVLLNIKTLTRDTISYLIGNGYDLNGYTIEPFSETGIVEGMNGKHYIINTEGCGDDLSVEEGDGHIAWYKKAVNEDENIISISLFPFAETNMSMEELAPHLTTNTMRLDAFIRSSGGERLERNYANWEKFLTDGVIENV